MILVTGGAGFIGANFVLDWLAQRRRAGRQSRQAHLRRQPRQPRVARRRSRATCSSAATSATRDARAHAARAASPARDRQLRRRDARRPLDPRSGSVHPDQRRRHVRAARVRARVVERAAGRRARRVPLPARVDRRGVRLARPGRRRRSPKTTPYAPEQSVCGVEGGVGSPGARVPPHVRVADADDELLEQLRPAAVSGEADSADDRQRARRQAAAGVRRRPQRARLALRRRSLRARSARCSTRGRPGETYNIGGNAEMTNIDVVHTICRLRRARSVPDAIASGSITFVKDRPGHDRRYAIDASKIRRELGWAPARDVRVGHARAPSTGISTNGEWLASVQSAEYRQWVCDLRCMR